MRYNLRSVGGKLARGLVGAGIGATAAAVQAGISITDGKYNPLEGIGSFAAGFAGGSRLTGGLQKTFMEGYDANLPEDEQRRRAVDDYIHRNDVRDTVEKAFPGADLNDIMDRIGNGYVQYGETDINKILKNIKNADKLKSKHGFSDNEADQQIRLIEREKKKLSEEGTKLKDVLYAGSEQDKYLDNRSGGDLATRQRYAALLSMMKEI